MDEALAAPGRGPRGLPVAVLCTPVAAIEALLGPVSRLLPDGAVLTDVGGREGAGGRGGARGGPPRRARSSAPTRCSAATAATRRATADRWKGGTVAVCTDGDAAAVDAVAALHEALGATVVRCTAAEHDAAVAMVSHLPYLVASALAARREGGGAARAARSPGRG